MDRIENEFGVKYLDYLLKQSQKFIADDLLSIENGMLKATKKGKFLTDGIASNLFRLRKD
jgi:oxygen-independent coproporphyrinogen-3 oxidase